MGKISKLDLGWRDWVVTNLRRGCSRESMISAMIEKDFEEQFATAAVSALSADIENPNRPVAEPAGSEPVVVSQPTKPIQQAFESEPTRLAIANVLPCQDRKISVLARLSKPEVLVLGDVLSEEECDELIRRSEVKLSRSTTIDPQTGNEIVIQNRSSFGTFFQLNEDDFIASIDRRLSELLHWPVDHSEGLQILRYQVGGEYRPHFDYFPPDDSGSEKHTAQGGQRIGTLVMYLNDVEDGGETIFPEIGFSVVPRRGHAVYFGYCNSRNQVDPLTLHGGAPVRAGVKWIATKWLRQHRRG